MITNVIISLDRDSTLTIQIELNLLSKFFKSGIRQIQLLDRYQKSSEEMLSTFGNCI